MNRLHTIEIDQATGETEQLFTGIKRAIGRVPNSYLTLGSNAPAVLNQVLQTGAVLKKGELSAREQEAINLAISEVSGCDYCLAAHSMMGKMAGFGVQELHELRDGGFSADAKLDALVKFALDVFKSNGPVPAEVLQNVKQAGYSDRQIVEALYAISAILFTNMLNRVNDTVLDFPKAP
ncbi:MAG TPA: carboxymuconolactone decarboxylase family protein [Dyella sp.]|uniref:carboxymuconolactone decarboxylase family protein n=1 Tax=Dyella sp. TaxID=1869338 RepID=UPI002D0B73EE|nr:carboxymuconolactone decarboxylase family protein [Dyella sp.]HTV86438.1 carboxymuconolactone decarboxylase family protein [Dyella sp.]